MIAGIAEIAYPVIIVNSLWILLLRITDMSVDTLRIMSMVRGRKYLAAGLGTLEAAIFIIAITHVLKPPIHWAQMGGYALGFGAGTLIGVAISQRISSGFVLLRVLSRQQDLDLAGKLRDKGYRITSVEGQGKSGPVDVLFGVIDKRMASQAIQHVSEVAPQAFVLIEPVDKAINGYIPSLPRWRPMMRR